MKNSRNGKTVLRCGAFGTLVLLVMFSVIGFGSASNDGTIYEADEGVGEGFILNNDHDGHTGNAFVQFTPNVPGGFVEWDVHIEEEGEYTLQYRYANGSFDNRPGEVQVNGIVIEEGLPFYPTGHWTVWETTETVTELEEGTHTIRLTGVGPDGGANIDHLRVIPGVLDDDDHISYPITDLNERMDESHIQLWNERGLLLETHEPNRNKPMTSLEWMAMINAAFDYTDEVTFPNIERIDVPSEVADAAAKWYGYTIRAAESAEYLASIDDSGTLESRPITRQEVALIMADLLELEPNPDAAAHFRDLRNASEEVKGVIGAIIAEAYMLPQNAQVFQPNRPFTHADGEQLMAQLQVNEQLPFQSASIASVDAIGPNTIAVTLNGYFEDISPYDIDITAATGQWRTLAPQLSTLTVTEASIAVNKLGYSVIVYEIEETLDENGQYKTEYEAPEVEYDQEIVDMAENLLTWQMEHGGWTKNWERIYTRPWDGEESRSEWTYDGVDLGTIDNDATTTEMRVVAEAYRMTGDTRFKDSVNHAFDFLLNMQYESGGFPQVYPQRGADESSSVWYSNYVTFNDNAMINVLELFDDAMNGIAPFDTDIIDDNRIVELEQSMDIAVDYILHAQIEVDGQLTAWCAQHDPDTYEPRPGRSYEHISISGEESVPVVRFLMSRPEQTEEIRQAVEDALTWLVDVRHEGIRYNRPAIDGEYFTEDPNSTIWYRFYEIGTNRAIFSGRDGIVRYDIMEIEQERRDGYAWAGTWPRQLLEVSQLTGYFEHNVYAQVTRNESQDEYGRSLNIGDVKHVQNWME